MGGQAGGQAGGRAGEQAGRQAGRRVGRRAGSWAGRRAGRRAGGRAGGQAGRQAGRQESRYAHTRQCGLMAESLKGLMAKGWSASTHINLQLQQWPLSPQTAAATHPHHPTPWACCCCCCIRGAECPHFTTNQRRSRAMLVVAALPGPRGHAYPVAPGGAAWSQGRRSTGCLYCGWTRACGPGPAAHSAQSLQGGVCVGGRGSWRPQVLGSGFRLLGLKAQGLALMGF